MDTVQFLSRTYRVCRWLYTVVVVLYTAFLSVVAVGTFFGVPLLVELDRSFNFGWKDAVIVILLALLGLMI